MLPASSRTALPDGVARVLPSSDERVPSGPRSGRRPAPVGRPARRPAARDWRTRSPAVAGRAVAGRAAARSSSAAPRAPARSTPGRCPRAGAVRARPRRRVHELDRPGRPARGPVRRLRRSTCPASAGSSRRRATATRSGPRAGRDRLPGARAAARARGPVHLVGNSLGGPVSRCWSRRRRPDLVASLTLISPAMPVYRVPPAFGRALPLLLVPGIPALAQRRMAGIPPERAASGPGAACASATRRGCRRPAGAGRPRDARARATSRGPTAPWPAHARADRPPTCASAPRNAWRAARLAAPPTLVVWGNRDRLVDPAWPPGWRRRSRTARLLVLAGVGHVAQLEAPETTARAVLGWSRAGLPRRRGGPSG